jgi:hypothetical protein
MKATVTVTVSVSTAEGETFHVVRASRDVETTTEAARRLKKDDTFNTRAVHELLSDVVQVLERD